MAGDIFTKCPAMEPMCQIMFYNQLQLLPPFTSGPWLQKWAGSTSVLSLMWNPDTGGGGTPSFQPWSQCVKSCFIINCQLLPPFTSGPWLQKWAGSTSVPSPMWNPDTGADTKCPAMEPMCQNMFYNQLPTFATIPAIELMCQIMFYNQLPTSVTIHQWTLAPEVGWFHIGDLTVVEL